MKRTAALFSAALLAGSVFAMPTYAQTESEIVPGSEDEQVEAGGTEAEETAPAEENVTGAQAEGSAADDAAETVNDGTDTTADGASSEEPAGGIVPGQTAE